jgi:hypothetical protein
MGADTIEVASGHCAMVSHSEETHERIVTATNAAAVPGWAQGPPSSRACRVLASCWSSPLYGPPSAAALSFSSEVSQRFLMSREAIGAASLPTPLKLTSSSTRSEVPTAEGVRL